MPRPDSHLLPAKPEANPRLYAWSSGEVARRWRGCLKVGQTSQDVNTRIKQSQGQARVDYVLEVDEPAEREDASLITDAEVRRRLIEKGFENVVFESSTEWMRCTADDVHTAIAELRALCAGSDHRAIKTGIDAFARTTDEFAARRMDKSIRSALAGHKVDELEL